PMIESYLSFAILKAAFDPPAPERHAQQLLDRRAGRSVAQEVFDLVRERVVAHEQMVRPLGQTLFVFDMDQHVLDAPNQRPFLGVLDPPGLPRLNGQRRVRLSQMLDCLRLATARHKTWDFPPTAPLPPTKWPTRHLRRLDPYREILGNFADKLLLASLQGPQERR